MKNVLLLVKVGLIAGLSGQGSKKRRTLRVASFGVTALIGSLLFLAYMGFYGYMLSFALDAAGVPRLLLSGGMALGMIVSLVAGMAKIPGALFAAKDFELLASLPVTHTELFLSKLALAYTFSMTGIAGVSLPFAVVYALRYGASVSYFVSVLLGLLIAPLLVCAVAGVAALGISRVASRSRAGNLVMLVLSLAFIVLVMLGSMSIGSLSDGDMMSVLVGYDKALAAFVPTGLFAAAALGEPLNLFWLLLICGVPFGLFAAFSAKVFRRVNLSMGERRTRSNFKAERLGRIGGKSVSAALFGRELKGYFSFYGYVMNTAVGGLMALIFAGLLLFGGEAFFAQAAIDATVAHNVILPLFVVMVCYCGTIAPPTAAGISIEGSRLWILQSLPVSAAQIFTAKLKLQLMIMWPTSLLAGIAGAVALKLDFAHAALAILLPMAYSLLSGLIGLVSNLLFPLMNWKNPMVPIKRGGSTLLCMALGALALGAPVAIFLLTGAEFLPFAVGVLAAVGLLCAALWRWLKMRGARRFYNI